MKRGTLAIDAAGFLSDMNVRALPQSLRAVLVDVLCHAQLSDEPGVLRHDLAAIAKAVHAGVDQLRALVSAGHVEGAGAGEQSVPLIHTDRRGEQMTLLPASEGPVWYVRSLVVGEYLRRRASEHGRRGAARSGSVRSAPPRVRDTPRGAPRGAPPQVSSPTPPSSYPPGKTPEEEARPPRGDAAAAENLAAAARFAREWIVAHRPDRLQHGLRPFTKLIARLGPDLAVAEVRTVELDPDVRDPFAVAWQNHDPQRHGGGRNGAGPAHRNGNGQVSKGEQRKQDFFNRADQEERRT